MSDERKPPPKVSISRIAFAAAGATIVLLSAVWIALPFLVFGGPAMTKWMTPAEWFHTPHPYFALPFMCYGLFLLRCSR